MSLKNDTFPLKRHWLSSAFSVVPEIPDVFAASRLHDARRRFLAGDNQLTAIRNWLLCSEVVERKGKRTKLSELGNLMRAQDPQARSPVTWWLVHLHLCANSDSFPYATFFAAFDVDGNWITIDDIVQRLVRTGDDGGDAKAVRTVETYFEGVEKAFRPGEMLFGLGLLERRNVPLDGATRRALRRTAIAVPDIVVTYAALLFHRSFFPKQTTVSTPELLKVGLSRSVGMRDKDFRAALSRIHHDKELAAFIQYRKQVNLDSIQFLKQGSGALRTIRTAAYRSGGVTWS